MAGEVLNFNCSSNYLVMESNHENILYSPRHPIHIDNAIGQINKRSRLELDGLNYSTNPNIRDDNHGFSASLKPSNCSANSSLEKLCIQSSYIYSGRSYMNNQDSGN